MAESMPNPTRAIDPASTPATIATVPSAPIQTRLIHDSCLTRRTAWRSVVAWAKAADLELRGRGERRIGEQAAHVDAAAVTGASQLEPRLHRLGTCDERLHVGQLAVGQLPDALARVRAPVLG